MSTIAELCDKWSLRGKEWRLLGVQVSGAAVTAEILADLRSLQREDLVTLGEASRLGGYSLDHLQRLVRQGTITNVGRKGAPRIRRADVPMKPGRSVSLPSGTAPDQLSARRRIVADAQTRKGA